MKLRIRANTLRLRLNQKEVDSLASGQVLSEKVEFPGGTFLAYNLQASAASEAQAIFNEGSLQILAPRASVSHWAGGEDIGLYFSLPTAADPLRISIEKDLVCIDGPADEIDPLAFPRQMSESVC